MEEIKKYWTKRNILIAIAVVVLMIVSYLFLPIFYVKHILILGNSDISVNELSSYTTQSLEKNTYLINKKKIEEEFLESPYIQSIKVSSKFPNKLIFNIIERNAVATVKFSGGFAILDDDGVVLETTPDMNNIKKPLISGIDVKELIVGEKVAEKNENIKLGMQIVSNIKSARILNNISVIDISDLNNVYMITPQGINVLLGEGKDLNEKMLVLERILLNLHERGISSGYVDMRYDAYPVYRSK